MRVWPGAPYPLGATWDGEGVNLALFSEHATSVELCLFEAAGGEPGGMKEYARVPLRERTDLIWHAYLPDLRPGAMFGFRVDGPYAPHDGHRFNPNKLLLCPYSRAISGPIDWDDALYGYTIGSPDEDVSFDDRDSAGHLPKSVVVDTAFTWGDDRKPNIPWNRTVIYECHVKGMTMQHPAIDPEIRGTYLAMASDPIVDHLHSLGVTAVELLPVHQFVNDRTLIEKGLSNYWGYNSIGFFAPHVGYATGGGGQQVDEFKSMVKTLHKAGFEVILDVVYNHTGEGNHLGPTLSFRGIDNASYYRLVPDDKRFYMDFSGTGNSLNMLHPRTMQLITDSLRYWVTDMHVDGFRFDLAPVLARELYEVNRLGTFFDLIAQDPVISQVKLIAEPWDLGEGGYQVGRFPVGWTEWNGKYRDVIRDYWKGEGGLIGDLAYRVAGSSDLYEHSGRRPYASVNFVTAHDGFTLRDLVSYNEKHNEANKDDNRDGENHNRSWNCGAEGPTDNPEIRALRLRQSRNLLASLLLSQGVPMLLAGDEVGRTQQGNNNAYCQDNELTWQSWEVGAEDGQLLEFVRSLIRLRQEHRVFRRRKFFQNRAIRGENVRDIVWLDPAGTQMSDEQWRDGFARSLAVFLSGRGLDERDERGRTIVDTDFLVLVNAHYETVEFKVPAQPEDARWELRMDTTNPSFNGEERVFAPGDTYALQGRAMALFEFRQPREKS
jgi:glycogen operon protein